jgi:hypothetical protein
MPRKAPSLARAAHGTGRNALLRVELPPLDEQPAPLPDAPEQVVRRADGTLASSAAAKALGARGGLARARRVRFVSSFGLGPLADDAPLAPWLASGEDLAAAELARLTRRLGGPPSASLSSLVTSWALQVVASRFAFAAASKTGDVATLKLGSGLAGDARQTQLTIKALEERELQERPAAPVDPLAAWHAPSTPHVDELPSLAPPVEAAPTPDASTPAVDALPSIPTKDTP